MVLIDRLIKEIKDLGYNVVYENNYAVYGLEIETERKTISII